MRKNSKSKIISIVMTLILVSIIAAPVSVFAAQLPVSLNTASNYAVLGGSTVTNTGTSVINGDVGLSPGLSITGFPPGVVTGTTHTNDAAAILAQADLTNTYNDVAGRTPVTATLAEELGGQTLLPGVYVSLTGKFTITGTLTLNAGNDPNAIFIFKTSTTLITAGSSIVSLTNGAQPFNVYWQVGSSATLGTSSDFKGNILALTSITATTSAVINGRLLARNGAVTLDTNTITITKPATLTIIKTVVNNDGGAAVSSNFNVKLSGIGVTAAAPGASSPGTKYTLVAGSYVVSEDAIAGYTGSFSGDSVNGNITLLPGDNKTITITNNDNPAPPVIPPVIIYAPLINVVKTSYPLAVTLPQGTVTYTYKVTNPGVVALSNVSVTDDKVSTVKYTSGDINLDTLLQPSEIWIYTSTANLTSTTTNTATARGSANGMTAADVALVTVVVSPAPIYSPIINIVKTANPLALPLGAGMVTYTYKVTNPGKVALSKVTVTDNRIMTVKYMLGDVNGDKLLQPSETWTYSATANLAVTTTNTATARGYANGMTTFDVAIATVVVAAPILPPLINIVKTPVPLELTSGSGFVTYTYILTNPGTLTLSNVTVTDDKIAPVTYISGDVNNDKLLQTSEIWTYRNRVKLTATTTNTATAKGSANGITVTSVSVAKVVVTQRVVETVTGGEIPKTATPWYNIFLAGGVLMILGIVGWRVRKIYE